MPGLIDLPMEILCMIVGLIYEPRNARSFPKRNSTFYAIRKTSKDLRNVTTNIFFHVEGGRERLDVFAEGRQIALEERYAILYEKRESWIQEWSESRNSEVVRDPWMSYVLAVKWSQNFEEYKKGIRATYGDYEVDNETRLGLLLGGGKEETGTMNESKKHRKVTAM